MDKARLRDQVRCVARPRHPGLRTEQAYADWIRRYVLFHRKRHPSEAGAGDIREFLSRLAASGRVSA